MKVFPTRVEKRGGKRRSTACSFFLVFHLLTAGIVRASSASEEYAIKAAFLYHFAQFAEWPESAFKDANAPLTFCTLGEDPFQGALDESISGKTIANRPLRVQHLKQIPEAQTCQVLFVASGDKKRVPDLLSHLKDSPVLTVGETEHFAQDGGMIGLCLEQNRIRFEVNLDSAERARLRISAKLLALAKTVIGSSRGN